MKLRFCNASGRIGTVTICQISGDFLWGCKASHDSRTRPEETSASQLVSLLQLLNSAITSANLTLCDHVNEFSVLLVVK